MTFLSQLESQKAFQKTDEFIVFGRDSRKWDKNNYIPVKNFQNIDTDKFKNKTVYLDDTGAYTNLRKIIEDFFGSGRHNNIQVIYIAHYAKDVLPIVRENITRKFIALNNQYSFFENIIQTYCIRGQKYVEINGKITDNKTNLE